MRHVFQTLIVITVIVCATLLCRPVNAQPILGAIVTADLPRYQQAHEAMVKVLLSAGFSEDKLKIFAQTPNADKMSLVNSLRRAESAGATIVVTYGCRATEVAKSELKDTPLLFADVYDPVALGIVKTLAAPGTDASGATSKTSLKQLVEALVAIKPVKKVGVLYTKGEGGSANSWQNCRNKAKPSASASLPKMPAIPTKRQNSAVNWRLNPMRYSSPRALPSPCRAKRFFLQHRQTVVSSFHRFRV